MKGAVSAIAAPGLCSWDWPLRGQKKRLKSLKAEKLKQANDEIRISVFQFSVFQLFVWSA
jgi:hypothetical protein